MSATISLRQWQATEPPRDTLVYVWAPLYAVQAMLAVWDGATWQAAHWDGNRWTTEGGAMLRDITHWHSAK